MKKRLRNRVPGPAQEKPKAKRVISKIWIAIFILVPALVYGILNFARSGNKVLEIPVVVQNGKWISDGLAQKYKKMSITSAMSESPADAQVLVEEVLSPLIGYLKSQYPIESIRNEIENIAEKLPIITTIAPKLNSIAFTGYSDPECKKAAIFINAVNFRIRLRWALVTFGEQGAEYMEDLLAMMILHEGYHALKQGFVGGAEAEKVYSYEAECWIYTCQKIDQIKAAGRGNNILGGIASMLETAIYERYQKLGRPRRVTPDWAIFIKSCYMSL